MTTRIAIFLGAALVALIATDLWMGWGGTLFAMQKLDFAVHWLAFWR